MCGDTVENIRICNAAITFDIKKNARVLTNVKELYPSNVSLVQGVDMFIAQHLVNLKSLVFHHVCFPFDMLHLPNMHLLNLKIVDPFYLHDDYINWAEGESRLWSIERLSSIIHPFSYLKSMDSSAHPQMKSMPFDDDASISPTLTIELGSVKNAIMSGTSYE
ncbi:hypothetical protein K501DRAFT_333671, partial [Backusella circina FSU 941]